MRSNVKCWAARPTTPTRDRLSGLAVSAQEVTKLCSSLARCLRSCVYLLTYLLNRGDDENAPKPLTYLTYLLNPHYGRILSSSSLAMGENRRNEGSLRSLGRAGRAGWPARRAGRVKGSRAWHEPAGAFERTRVPGA